MIFTIYKATNKINKKIYIGFDSSWPRRRKNHKALANTTKDNMHFHRAIRKYGWNNFEWEVIYQSKDENYTRTIMEPFFINEYNSLDSSVGYNGTRGGEGALGYKHTEEHKKKMSILYTGRTLSTEQKIKISLAKKGQSLSIEHRNKAIRNLIRNNPPQRVLQKRAKACAKMYICISPDNVTHKVHNLKKFCRGQNLNPSNMYSLAKGRGQTYRSWKCFNDNVKDK